MRVAFMGSPGFAVPALMALHAAGHDVVAVYCQPPRPVGRGHRIRKCPVHEAADQLGLTVRTPERLRRDDAERAYFRGLDLDVAVVAAYGQILPADMLAAPRRGCINIHASLLPRWRGAAPIHAAVLAGDTQTGVTIMQMDEGLDTGAMLLAESLPIGPEDTTADLHDRLAALGARLILKALQADCIPVPQPEIGATYAPKLSKADAVIDWSTPAAAILRRIRAFQPWPGTETRLDGETLKILRADAAEGQGEPGTVLDDRLTIACGEAAIRLTLVQRAGRAAMPAEAFLRGHSVGIGTRLG
ncbi:MAG TPA: methionyl-tRNA formyltransferase [Acidiphilium sp.]|jgi:methionyl-tRNA formyltransferase|uniref:methionyl-tRNA formyltransferase n=1 Tax=unclassified Acidiphilium TaxID=2617493 RepID=UPI000BD6054E|nr:MULTISPECIES: methionyl-tRNA formyltransferase [unclassified Acidiphilium]OYV55236.1 MAG: methionyl-tRNA formyltransferase [Acidiphilium sp. 20-67-58]HQT61771.1 methionyl-tRNA formyltransferase [Acidiphilium sp.]HQU10491.1 methionyl-tRNA formyltransferase [Acidiphilium sp.]